METWPTAAREQAAKIGDLAEQAILLADDAAQKGKREVSFRPSDADLRSLCPVQAMSSRNGGPLTASRDPLQREIPSTAWARRDDPAGGGSSSEPRIQLRVSERVRVLCFCQSLVVADSGASSRRESGSFGWDILIAIALCSCVNISSPQSCMSSVFHVWEHRPVYLRFVSEAMKDGTVSGCVDVFPKEADFADTGLTAFPELSWQEDAVGPRCEGVCAAKRQH
ncbi:unnamed protein product [Symbiodinium sp. CCMP2592]|nr:unnamed protein product [Symbiodinium sp. CCMP2592]